MVRNGSTVFLIGTRWFGVLGPCREIIRELEARGTRVMVFGQSDVHWRRYHNGRTQLVRIAMRRSYTTLYHDALDVCKLVWYGLRLRPSVVHSFNPKPAMLAFAAVLFLPRARFLIGVTGLGNTFIRARRMEWLVTWVLRQACRRASFIFFQNPDDRQLFSNRRLGAEGKYRMFIGPGVDLREFTHSPDAANRDAEVVRFVCVARLIWQKGIREYVEAAELVMAKRPGRVEFLLVGDYDEQHPDCVDETFVDSAVARGVIRHIRWTDRLPAVLATCHVLVLHSYREGAPRAILEGSAMALPTIGSDAVGVRELVRPGRTGLLTPLKDVAALAAAMLRFVDEPEFRESCGQAALREIAEPLSLENASRAQLEMYEGAIG